MTRAARNSKLEKTFKVRHGNRVLEIPEISKAEAKKYQLIGTAEGGSDDHCLYLALKHGYMFLDRVVGYVKIEPTNKNTVAALAFYGQPTPREWSPRKKKKD